MEEQEEEYEVVITEPAEVSFFEVCEFLYENYSLEKAETVANSLRDYTKSLSRYPQRGALERRLYGRVNPYRFILFKRTSRSEIKIIYYVDNGKVYVTDFFPTEKDDSSMK